jgi:hypothetical protein
MVTSGDIQFEQPQLKVAALTSNAFLLIAGDFGLQSEVCQRVEAEVTARVNQTPNDWWKISDIADLCVKHYNEVRDKKAEQAILKPVGLDWGSWVTIRQKIDSSFVHDVSDQLSKYALRIDTLAVGCDDTGGHIYRISDGEAICEDGIGFGCIGAGANHADPYFMLAGHSKYASFAQTLLLVYHAKKRSEVAPGVGKATDMLVVGLLPWDSYPVGEKSLEWLDTLYEGMKQKEVSITKEAEDQVARYLEVGVEASPVEGPKPLSS